MDGKTEEQQALELAKQCVFKMYRHGNAQKWDELEVWDKCLTDTAAKFPKNEDIHLWLANGAFNAMRDYGDAQKWDELETWGKRLTDTTDKFPKNKDIHLWLANGAFNAMRDYGDAQKWDELEIWGKYLTDTADKFPKNGEIQLRLAEGALSAIASYAGEKDRDDSYNKWCDALFGCVNCNPDNIRIQSVIRGGELETLLGCKSWQKVPEKFLEFWVIQNAIVSALKVESDSDLKAAHYTSHDTFNNHIIGENAENAKMSLYSVASANDPMEGKVLGKFLGSQGTARYDEKMVAAQTSFSPMVDCLNQFRLYSGQGQEGKGICLVFNKNYFSEAEDPASYFGRYASDLPEITSEPTAPTLAKRGKDETGKLHLYWVLYYDYRRTAPPEFIHTPAHQATALRIDASESDTPTDAKSDAERKKWEERNRKIGQMMRKLRKIYTDICANGNEKDKEKAKEDAWQVLIYLRHLVKDAAFAEEREMRMLKLYRFDKVKRDNKTERLYFEYFPIFGKEHVLDEVIVGPLRDDFTQKTQLWKHIIATNHKNKDIPMPKFTQSQAPLAPTSCPTKP